MGLNTGPLKGLEPPHGQKPPSFDAMSKAKIPTLELRQWKHHREMVDFPEDQHALYAMFDCRRLMDVDI